MPPSFENFHICLKAYMTRLQINSCCFPKTVTKTYMKILILYNQGQKFKKKE